LFRFPALGCQSKFAKRSSEDKKGTELAQIVLFGTKLKKKQNSTNKEMTRVSENAKRAIVGLIGGMGLILLLVGAVAHVYATTGVILMFGCWLIADVVARFWGD